ncbi:glycosyl hydrolase family 18 protein [Arsenicicoccus sp. oral taxon 190]|uniref:glycosyl hydrolase family 18 protein n=1 Tax=Arsenicicoccus sp. oral taxon 190 TaxID=1658671 RepID=UPI000679F919|nr:glycosyl hydrolase family 18 protein [Arsenicicoccus sp. oral taxon 190]AKT51493.1 hypothetical protein ADJ73_09510 [Arsenicicoccus sp. oral taxon 190]
MADGGEGRGPGRSRRRPRLPLPAALLLVALVVAALVAAVRPWSARGWFAPRGPTVLGAIPHWDQEDAVASLRAHPGTVTVASPWSYGVAEDGRPTLQPGLTTESERRLVTQLRELGLRVIPTVASTTDGLWDKTTVPAIMADPTRRRAHVEALARLVQDEGYDGLQLDYEDVPPHRRDDYLTTVRELADQLHDHRHELWVTVHAKETDAGYDQRNVAQDYRAIGESADQVVLMAYDWHWETGPAGPIGPADWVERVIRYAVTQVPRDKLVLGVGLFGYDWGGPRTQVLTWRQISEQAQVRHSDELWDLASQSPHLTYEEGGARHEVWYENARSVREKLRLAATHRLGGVALWRLGREDPAIWDLPEEVWRTTDPP